MIKSYLIYDKNTLSIKRKIMCTEDSIEVQLMDETEGYLEGDVDMSIFRVNPTEDGFEEFSIIEKEDAEFLRRSGRIPAGLDISLSDVDLNTLIEEYFLGRVSANTWRKDNYIYLRKLAYSSLSDRADATVKISSTDPDMVLAGNTQLAELNAHDLAVKLRFPKE